jgi:hypothetical protein
VQGKIVADGCRDLMCLSNNATMAIMIMMMTETMAEL